MSKIETIKIHKDAISTLRWSDNFGKEEYLTIYRTDSDEKWNYPAHKHEGFFDIFYISNGTINHWINDQKTTLLPGQFIIAKESDKHSLSGNQFRAYNISMNSTYWESSLKRLKIQKQWDEIIHSKSPAVIQVPETQRNSIETLLEGLILNKDKDYHLLWAEKFTTLFLVDFVFNNSLPRSNHPTPEWLSQCLIKIEENLHDPFLKSQLPKYASKSPEHIARSFRTHLQTTPSTFINKRRLEKAASILTNTNRPIADICYDLGFDNLNYFYKLFKQFYTQSPGHYRKAHQHPWV